MKKDLHPKYYPNAAVTCSCGNSFAIGSTKESLAVEICSSCHPFFTGNEKMIDAGGRVERFRRIAKAAEKAPKKKKTESAAEKKNKRGEKEKALSGAKSKVRT